MELREIAKQFKLTSNNITYLDKYGEGHINTTYLLVVDDSKQYILQKINNHIFPNVDKLMNNINLVLEHLKEHSVGLTDPDRQIMHIVKTRDDALYFYDKDNDSYYRLYDFVTDSVALQTITDASLFRESAIGFGKFALDLQSFDASKLFEVIPNFHNTKSRFEHFKATLAKDSEDRAKTCKPEIDFVLSREKYTSIIIDKINDGSVPLRVTHNDTKLNNILLDEHTLKSLCVIDLDTIMPGSLLYDFGDSIRFGCNPAGENEKDVSKVVFNIEYFKAFVDGYLSQVGSVMTKDELELLPFGAILMTYECGVRFLDDYLDGDHYFKTHYADHNLIRARTQFKLVEDMEKCLDEMKQIVKDATK